MTSTTLSDMYEYSHLPSENIDFEYAGSTTVADDERNIEADKQHLKT